MILLHAEILSRHKISPSRNIDKVERVVFNALRVAALSPGLVLKRRFLRLAANGHRLEDKTIHLDGREDDSMTLVDLVEDCTKQIRICRRICRRGLNHLASPFRCHNMFWVIN